MVGYRNDLKEEDYRMFRGLGGIQADDVGGRVPAAILEIMSGSEICKSIASDPDPMCSAGESGVGATVSRTNTYGRTHALFEDVHTTLNSHELFEDVLYAKLLSLSLRANYFAEITFPYRY